MRKLYTLICLFTSTQFFAISDRASMLVCHVKECIKQAEMGTSKITQDILSLQGMSGAKGRHLLNNICSLPNTTYLEIGCWKGSTFVSALYGNQSSIVDAIAIDNWSEFCESKDGLGTNDPKIEFLSNIQRYVKEIPIRFFEGDCFSLPLDKTFTQPVSIYFYDGNHSTCAQEYAFTYFNHILDNTFIAIVDDWNWQQVRQGTKNAFAKLNYKVVYEQELLSKPNDPDSWWNGIYIAVVEK